MEITPTPEARVGWLRRRVAAFWNGCAWVV
jgi:hypothetical protein